jgi:hypothetical protein
MGSAFDLLRGYSRSQNQRLAETAAAIVGRALDSERLRTP